MARAKSQERLCRLKKDAKIIASQHGELHLANFLFGILGFSIYLSIFQYLFDTNMLGLTFYNKFILLPDQSSKIVNLEILYIRFNVLLSFQMLLRNVIKQNFKCFNTTILLFLGEIFVIKESEFSCQFPMLSYARPCYYSNICHFFKFLD